MHRRLSAVVVLSMLIGCTAGEMQGARVLPKTNDAPGTPEDREQGIGEFTPKPARASVVASLPDRGELLAYDRTRQVKRFDAATFHPVTVSEEHALNAIESGQLTVTSPEGELIRLKYMVHFQHPGNRWTWLGRAEGGALAALNFGVNEVSGALPFSGDKHLHLGSSAQGAWLATTDGAPAERIDGAPFAIPLASSAALDGMIAKSNFGSPGAPQPAAAKTTPTAASLRMARHDVDGDRRADILWTFRNGYDTQLSIWFMQGSALLGGRYFQYANPEYNYPGASGFVLGAGDLDGNGVADVVHHEVDQGFNPMYVVSPIGPNYTQLLARKFVPSYPHRYPYGWDVAGILDMNGDGRSDIGWVPDRFEMPCQFDPPAGKDQLSRWYLDHGVLLGGRLDDLGECQQNVSRRVLPGDFDGNGVGDFALITRAQGLFVRILLTMADGSPAVLGNEFAIPSDWLGPFASGDLNHDGKIDLVFRSSTNGLAVHVLFMDGSVVIGTKSEPLPAPWFFALSAVADFDGDGDDELLWTGGSPSDPVGHVLMWRMRQDETFEGSYVGSYPKGWRVINSTY